MPAIQAMRSDAMALRAKEDIQEKIPSFYNSVNQALGQSIIQGQDAAEQLISSRFEAANKIAAELRQKLDGKGGLTEQGVAMTMKLISSTLSTILTVLGKSTTTKILDLASALANFMLEQAALRENWDAAVATYAQWTVQAGYTGHGLYFGEDPAVVPPPTPGSGADVQIDYNLLLRRTGGPNPPDNGTVFSSAGVDQQNIPSDLVAWDSDTLTSGTQAVEVTINRDLANSNPDPDATTKSVIMYSPSLNEYFITYSDRMTIKEGDTNVPVPDATLTLSKTTTPSGSPPPPIWTHTGNAVSGGGATYSVAYPSSTDIGPQSVGYVTYMRMTSPGPPVPAASGGPSYNWSSVGLNQAKTSDIPPGDIPDDLVTYYTGGNTVQVSITPPSGDPHGPTQTNVLYSPSTNSYYISMAGQQTMNFGDPPLNITSEYTVTTSPTNVAGTGTPGGDDWTATASESGTNNTLTFSGNGWANANVVNPGGKMNSMGGRGAIKYRDALTPRWTDRRNYANTPSNFPAPATALDNYDYYYAWGSVGSITRVGQES